MESIVYYILSTHMHTITAIFRCCNMCRDLRSDLLSQFGASFNMADTCYPSPVERPLRVPSVRQKPTEFTSTDGYTRPAGKDGRFSDGRPVKRTGRSPTQVSFSMTNLHRTWYLLSRTSHAKLPAPGWVNVPSQGTLMNVGLASDTPADDASLLSRRS